MTAAEWHRAVIAAERDLAAYFARWSRVHPPVPYPPATTAAARMLALTFDALEDLRR